MNGSHLGDSYDIVKQVLLEALGSLGDWSAHPMLSAPFDDKQAEAYGRLLGVPLLSLEVLNPATDRRAYLAKARDSLQQHVFLDPDIGLKLAGTQGKKAPKYLFGGELVEIAERSSKLLVLVFDQCLQRGKEEAGIDEKRAWLRERGLSSIAYHSHASFLVVGQSHSLVARARAALLDVGRIPEERLIG